MSPVRPKRNSREQLLLLNKNSREKAIHGVDHGKGSLIRFEPEKFATESESEQSSSGRIVIRAHGVESEFL